MQKNQDRLVDVVKKALDGAMDVIEQTGDLPSRDLIAEIITTRVEVWFTRHVADNMTPDAELMSIIDRNDEKLWQAVQAANMRQLVRVMTVIDDFKE